MSQLPEIGAKVNPVDLPRPKTYLIEGWGSMGDAKRLKVIREVALRRGRDPRIATLVIQIIREAGCQPREYEKQAAALLKWVQNPKNIYYVNEPGERLQDPLYTLKVKYGDCDDMALLLCCFFESIKLEWKLVISGRNKKTRQKVRHVEGHYLDPNAAWSHIYCAVGTPPFNPKKWYYCEPTLQGVPLGWDVVSGSADMMPEMGGSGGGGGAVGRRAFAAVDLGLGSADVRPDIRDPALNLKDVTKELLLLEDHLTIPDRQCPDCIRKHLLKSEALLDEALQLDTEQKWKGLIVPARTVVVKTRQAYEAKTPFTTLSGNIRTLRKELTGKLGAVGAFAAPDAGAAVAAAMEESGTRQGGINWRNIGVAVVTGVATSVTAQIILEHWRESRAAKRKLLESAK